MSEECKNCDATMELKASWVTGMGMTFSILQCPECKDIELSMADKPLQIEQGTCPRCFSENPLIAGPNAQGEYECPDCGLIFREKRRAVDEKREKP